MFEIDQEYPREALLKAIGSKQKQSGIIWGPKNPNTVIVTSGGRHQSTSGYHDKKLSDGSWLYIGQGSKGDQDINRHANKLIASAKREVLLFTTREPTAEEIEKRASYAKRYRFEGIYACKQWEYITPDTGRRSGDRLICFRLVPISNSAVINVDNKVDLNAADLNILKRELLASLSPRKPMANSLSQVFERSQMARSYALNRAGGICELCGSLAPFKTRAGDHFLEVHHIEHLAKGGLDHPVNLAALCPNCHRAIHLSNKVDALVSRLKSTILAKEAD